MKFQSLIEAIMHGVASPARTVLLAACFASTGCVGLMSKRHTYSASSPAVVVNGAEVRMQVKPEGTDGGGYAMSAMVVSAAAVTFDGPFRWRVEAVGRDGIHQSLVVHRIHTRTGKTKRDEWYPAAELGYRADFKPAKDEPGESRALYQIPGLLVVKPREDGPLTITVDLSVVADGKRARKLVRFRMDPGEKRQDEFIFVPAEIVRSFGESPADWDESGWD